MARKGSTYVQEFTNPPSSSERAPLPPLPRQRRRRMLVLGLLLVLAGALSAGYLFTGVSDRTAVILLSRDVPVGTRLAPADLATTRVAADAAVAVIPGRQLHEVVGRYAAVGLRKGTLLSASQLTTTLSPGAGQQVVPISMKLGQLPARGLNPGDQVLMVATPDQQDQGQPAQSSGTSAQPDQDTPAAVDQVSSPDADGLVRVDLVVDARVGPSVAKQAATGRLALVLTSRAPR